MKKRILNSSFILGLIIMLVFSVVCVSLDGKEAKVLANSNNYVNSSIMFAFCKCDIGAK